MRALNTTDLFKILRDTIKHIFLLCLCGHLTKYSVHWASNETAAIEIFPNAHQNEWRYIV